MKSILKNIKDEKETYAAIIDYVKSAEENAENEMVLFDKLNTLIEVYQFYPLIIKKDKNHSSNIY